MIKKLNELKAGQRGIIVSFKGKGDLKRYLMGMGFVKGADIELRRVAPLGDPVEIRIKGYSISLRKEEAKNIEVNVK
ncbi:MAG: FeoA family protein [Methanobacteriaceae archaeon]|nr:FeoA family protein [Methanobacteriaceae archaeon]MDZ4172526.1 FeoA family protein [Methanobacteriaceae archaeon]